MPLEASLETTFVSRGEARGLVVLKMVPVGRTGFPDRTILGAGQVCAFAELKRPGEVPEPLQLWWIDKLRELGYVAEWLDHVDQVDGFYDRVEAARR